MVARTLTDCNPNLIAIAREVCSKEGLDFDTLEIHQARGLLYFWCLTCRRTYPLTDLVISKKRKVCTHCGLSIKMHGASNKFGKLRRAILFRRLGSGLSGTRIGKNRKGLSAN